MLGISDAAESIGFRTVGVKIPFEVLAKEAPFPCIVHWSQRHFVVVHRVTRSAVHVADPAAGLITFTKEEFKNGWLSTKSNGQETGVALLFWNRLLSSTRKKVRFQTVERSSPFFLIT